MVIVCEVNKYYLLFLTTIHKEYANIWGADEVNMAFLDFLQTVQHLGTIDFVVINIK